MVGAGAVVGTLSGEYIDAARSPEPAAGVAQADNDPIAMRPALARAVSVAQNRDTDATADAATNTSVVGMTAAQRARAAAEPAQPPTNVIASRFPGNWEQDARRANGDNDSPAQVLAYAAESQRGASPSRPATASASGFRLASVDRQAEPEPEATPEAVPVPMPKRMARPAPAKPSVLFNDAQIASIKTRLRLSRDQEQYWPQVESALRAISWKVATQQGGQRLHSRQQAAMIDPNSPEVARLKSAAFPLIMSLRSDQKEEVRQLAHTMGLTQVASMF
jgi:hypothetical protein